MDIGLIEPMKSSMDCLCPEAGSRRAAIKAIITAASILFLVVGLAVPRADAVNSVVVESKSFSPGQTACSVGVFVTNDVPIEGIVIPLEIRVATGEAFISTVIPGSFKFKVVAGNRLDSSPLGSAGDRWPRAITVTDMLAAPMGTNTCSGPLSSTFASRTASVDGESPDAVFHAALGSGDPSSGELIELMPGSDPAGTENASLIFVFNVNDSSGCFWIDSCCVTPSNHLSAVGYGPTLIPLGFERGTITIGDVNCTGGSGPEPNTRPVARCRGSVQVTADSSGFATVRPEDFNAGSWDVEDGANLTYSLDPPGPFTEGAHTVRLSACDQDYKCGSCNSSLYVHPAGFHPSILCKDSVVVEIDSVCTTSVSAEEFYTGAWDDAHGTDILVEYVGRSSSFSVGTTPVTVRFSAPDGAWATYNSKVVVRHAGPLYLKADPDTVRLRYTGNSELDTLSKSCVLRGAICGGRLRVAEYKGLLLGYSHRLDRDPPRVWANLGVFVASRVPSGLYPGWIIIENPDNMLRDTIHVEIRVDHPIGQEVAPNCDSLCGVVLDLEGEPVKGAEVTGYICDRAGNNCGRVTNIPVLSDSTGAFCIPTYSIAGVRIEAKLRYEGVGYATTPRCSSATNYVYIVPCERCWGGGPQFLGPEFGMNHPPCISEGFVGTAVGDSFAVVAGAAIDLWDSYPDGERLRSELSDENGYYFVGRSSGDLVVRARGHCPEVVSDFQCGFGATQVTLSPLSVTTPPDWPYFAQYSANAEQFTSEGQSFPLVPGDLITATDPQGVVCGIDWVLLEGTYQIRVIGDDPATPEDEGAVDGDTITLWLNCRYPTTADSVWRNIGQPIGEAGNGGGTRLLPTEYALLQNYPNPFNAGTVMTFDLIQDAEWALIIYNVMGQRVRSFAGQSAAGRVNVPWDGRDGDGASLATGVYFYRLSANDFTGVRKMLLIK